MDFQVFNNGKPVNDFRLSGAYLFGNDGIALRKASIEFKDGVIRCRRPNMTSAGLALLWDVEGFGKVLLPTTCLPDRKEPYNLNVEIARGKLMKVTQKCEDWAFFNGLEELDSIAEKARGLFIKAIQNISQPAAASRLADESLKQAMVLSEKLALKQAYLLFKNRGRNRGFGKRCLGCIVDPKQIGNPAYVKNLLELFGFVTVPVSWAQVEPVKGKYNFSSIDACISALGKKRLAVCVGPLLCFSRQYLPGWITENRVKFETVRDNAYRFILRMVSRYANRVHAWRVLSGLNSYNFFGFNFEQVLEITRAVNLAAKTASSRSVKIIEVSSPWGEYYATTPNAIPPMVYVDMVAQSGINFDAFGLQLHFGKNQLGMHVRDMMQISDVLDYFGLVAKPLYITGVEVPGQSGDGLYDDELAGFWHNKWNQENQAEWLEQFYKIALSKPFVDTVTYGNLSDVSNSLIANSGLFNEKLEPKESFKTLKKMHTKLFSVSK